MIQYLKRLKQIPLFAIKVRTSTELAPQGCIFPVKTDGNLKDSTVYQNCFLKFENLNLFRISKLGLRNSKLRF
ncbi:hypothetical protein C4544_02495 [candidate division WS5 bacterium]|uniref:Uncharacterized protein n=1 Tax=candidate division WS5 bacterium TaxID=2093353 RepID=A0A419DEP9_9BACT|nr:MAG: hypothetical protein C4544_02495 [candidate division WS5 bacterium]